MTERQQVSALRKGARASGWHEVLIPDDPAPSSRRPYDCALVQPGGLHHAVEAKAMGKTSMSWNITPKRRPDGSWVGGLREWQEKGLLSAARTGACAWVVMFIWRKLSDREARRRGSKHLREAWAVSIGDLLRARDVDGITLFHVDWWQENGIHLPRLRTEGKLTPVKWDPTPLLVELKFSGHLVDRVEAALNTEGSSPGGEVGGNADSVGSSPTPSTIREVRQCWCCREVKLCREFAVGARNLWTCDECDFEEVA